MPPSSVENLSLDVRRLMSYKDFLKLQASFRSDKSAAMWTRVSPKLDSLAIPVNCAGVNGGDRRALFQITCSLAPRKVLEIGTNIGASTIHIALALQINGIGNLDTIDLHNANSEAALPGTYGQVHRKPKEMLVAIGCSHVVRFLQGDSLSFLRDGKSLYDFIFVDGDHTLSHVYQELPLAVSRLKPGGLLLLHDYFPSMKPLWSDGKVLEGVFLAVERYKMQGYELQPVPLGKLPWITKLRSRKTSLAALCSA